MKFNRGLVLCVFLMSTYTINVCATEAKAKNNIMGFMEDFLSKSNNGDLAAQALSTEKSESYSFKETTRNNKRKNKKLKKSKEESETEEEMEEENGLMANATMSMEAPGLNPNTTERVKDPNPVLEEWFMISSKAFLNTNRFPTIGKEIK